MTQWRSKKKKKTTQTKPPLISSFFLLHIFDTHFGTLSTGPFENDTAKILLQLFLHFTY